MVQPVSARGRTRSVEIDGRGRHLFNVVVVDVVSSAALRRKAGSPPAAGSSDSFHGCTGSVHHSETTQ